MSCLPLNIHAFLISPMPITFPARVVFLSFITVIRFGEA